MTLYLHAGMRAEKKLMATTPKAFLHGAHHWLILHGRYICQARKPKCAACPIADLCEYEHKEFLFYGERCFADG